MPCASTPTSAPVASAALAIPEITIYHLENRRSERIVWLMEELGMPYKLVFTRGNLAASNADIVSIISGVYVAPPQAVTAVKQEW